MISQFDLELEDRIAKIKAIDEQYDLRHNAFISFSGGKDSLILHKLFDLALPDNKIPRIYGNTGIEYGIMIKYVKSLAEKDDRFVIINQTRNIKQTLEKYGYPFKSKEHSLRVEYFNKGSTANYISKYITGYDANNQKETSFKCPKSLLYQFEHKGEFNYSNKCCYKLKKDLIHSYSKTHNLKIKITGIRKDEGGNRRSASCVSVKGGKLKTFNPLIVISDEFEVEFIKRFNLRLCDLYYPPYNFKRTGCKGCPYNLELQKDLETMKKYLPNEYKACQILWKPVYDEYRRIGFRLEKEEEDNNG